MLRKMLILASKSLERQEILRNSRINFKVIRPVVKEAHIKSGVKILRLVKYNACLKAESVAKRIKKGIVLGLDTLVLFKKRIFGKLHNLKEARVFLKEISGKKLEVYTGICLIDLEGNLKISDYDKTILYVRKIHPSKIDKYLKKLGPFDKAGGFSIEGIGAVLFDKIQGSYFNVLGLPLRKLGILFERMGLDIFDFVKR